MIKAVIIQPACTDCGFVEMNYPEFPDFHLLGTARNVSEGIHLIRDRRPNLVFLDVELPDGSGFEVLEATKDLSYEKIILSEESRYLFKAVRFDVADYLVKPLLPDALRTSIHKLIFSRGGTRIQKMYDEKFRQRLNLDFLLMESMCGPMVVKASQILRIMEVDGLAEVILENGARIPLLKTNRQLYLQLAHSGFFRINAELILRLREDLDLENRMDGCICRFPDGFEVNIPLQKINPLRNRLADLDIRT